jgi:acetyltransferase-like isoleucine patch superfamily enzyme
MHFIVKAIWYILRQIRSKVKYLYFKSLQGSYFTKIGRGTAFYGKVRFGSLENNIGVGKNCMIGHDVFLSAQKGSTITLGDNCSINTGTHLVATVGITIMDGTRIGEFCSIRDQNHSFENIHIPIHMQGFTGSPILINENCWIGRGVMITSGVELGEGCVVGANSVVTKSFESNSIIAGVPAKLIRKRGELRKS